MTPHYPLGRSLEETDERPRTISVTDDDLRDIHRSTRQILADQDGPAEWAAWDKSWKEQHPEWYPDKDGKPWDVYWAEYWRNINRKDNKNEYDDDSTD